MAEGKARKIPLFFSFFDRLKWGITGLAVLLLIWWLFALLIGPGRLPAPLSVFKRMIPSLTFITELYAQLVSAGAEGILPHLAYSTRSILIGTALGATLGIGTGLALEWKERVKAMAYPSLMAIGVIPPLVLLPFLVLWFGAGLTSQLALLVMYVFFMLLIYTMSAIDNVPPVYKQFSLTMGASRGQVFRTVVLPAIVPELTGGIRVVLAMAWGLQVIAEVVGSPIGMGQVLVSLVTISAVDVVIVGLIYIAIVATAIDIIFLRMSRYITRWMPR